MTSVVGMLGFSDELQKIAARKALKLIRQAMGKTKELRSARRSVARKAGRQHGAVQKKVFGPIQPVSRPSMPPTITPGGLTEAKRVAALPGAVKHSPQGSQIYNLGRGSEGMATAVARPMSKDPIQVRKLYDPKGLTTDEVIRRKHVVGKAIGENPNVARYYGQRAMPGGGKAQFSEFVPAAPHPQLKEVIPTGVDVRTPIGRAAALKATQKAHGPVIRADLKAQRVAKMETERVSAAAGFPSAQDVRPANMVLDARTGKYKTVDFIPGKKGEFLTADERVFHRVPARTLATTETGSARLINPVHASGATPQRQLMGMLSRKPRPTMRAAPFRQPAAAGSSVATAVSKPRIAFGSTPKLQPQF